MHLACLFHRDITYDLWSPTDRGESSWEGAYGVHITKQVGFPIFFLTILLKTFKMICWTTYHGMPGILCVPQVLDLSLFWIEGLIELM